MDFMEELYTELLKGDCAEQVLRDMYDTGMSRAEREQDEIAAQHQNRVFMKHGQKTAAIHPKFYHYWGQRLGYECWDDKQFLSEFLRDNENCRVRSKSPNAQVGWMAASAYRDRQRNRDEHMVTVGSSGSRFTKNYGVLE